ncbi:hypothetical protein [Spiroplasma ixodetis]|uniref:hypothetical protein n=1 Tax=Spiroplasma ixodetis TaxID=2141 RepID=UPI0024932F87|nr:hypothetical protein [Spiroplasma ixodetis]
MILNKTENLPISFKEGVGPYLVKQIKEAMLFNKYYKIGLIRYPNLTKDIADFYNSLTIDELQKAFLPLCTIFKFYHINAEKSLSTDFSPHF